MPWNRSFLLIVVLFSCKSSPLTSRKGCFCELIVILWGAKRAAFRGCYQCFWGLVFVSGWYTMCCKYAVELRIYDQRYSWLKITQAFETLCRDFSLSLMAKWGYSDGLPGGLLSCCEGSVMLWVGGKGSEDMSKLTHPHPIDSLILSTMFAKCSL